MKLMKTLKALSRLPEIVEKLDNLDERLDVRVAAENAKLMAEVRREFVTAGDLDDALDEKRSDILDYCEGEFAAKDDVPDGDDFVKCEDFDPDDYVQTCDLPCDPDELAEADEMNGRIDRLEEEIQELKEKLSEDTVAKARDEAEKTISFFAKLNDTIRTGLKSALEEM